MAEVREQVLNYIPVMARPLVLNRTTHPIIWTPIYADITVSSLQYCQLLFNFLKREVGSIFLSIYRWQISKTRTHLQ